MTKPPETWDLFCRVVDNFGDIGIAWRLAKQLADGDAGSSRQVRLFVDDLAAFAHIEPRVDASRTHQRIADIAIERWPASATNEAAIQVADVAIEVLGCGLPQRYLDAMVAATVQGDRRVVWIDLDHLTAETWVDGFHGLPSPHPTLPLVKHFFHPGFGAKSGGLWIEPDLERRRRAFVADHAQVAAFLRQLGAPSSARSGARVHRLSLFAYPDAPVAGLLDALAADPSRRWSVLVPEGVLEVPLAAWFGDATPDRCTASSATRMRGSLSVTTFRFVDQADYDRLLWVCDANFVRGEDSFVRAQAAGRPLVWHVYPQADGADVRKRAAFEALYDADLPEPLRRTQRALWNVWNERHGAIASDAALVAAAAGWLAALPSLTEAAEAWRRRLSVQTPLVERLAGFVAHLRGQP